MNMPFQLDGVPLWRLIQGTVPLKTKENSPLVLLTDGNASERTLNEYRFCMGRDDIEIRHISQMPELIQPYLFIVEQVREGATWVTDNPIVHMNNTYVLITQMQAEFAEKFPDLLEENT